MVEVGQLQISGTIDTSDIDRGFARIKGSFNVIDVQAKSAQASFDKLGRATANFGKGLILIGSAGVGALTALATKSPVLAPTFARMQVAMLELSNTAGNILKPIFETIANDLIPGISNAIKDNEGSIKSFVNVAATGFQDLSNLIQGNFKDIDNLGLKLLGGGAGAVVGGAVAGPGGAIAGGGIGAMLAGGAIPGESKVLASEREQYGSFAESAAIVREMQRQSKEAVSNKDAGDLAIVLSTGSGALILNSFVDLFQFVFSKSSKKDIEMSSSAGAGR